MTKLEETIQNLQVALYDYNLDRTKHNAYDVFYYAMILYARARQVS